MSTVKQRAFIISQNLETLYTKDHAQVVAWWLLEKVTGKNKAFLLVTSGALSEPQEQKLQEWENLLVTQKYPLQYILETVPFGPLELFVAPPTLIPRPETEEWCAELIKILKPYKAKPLTFLDLCSGSGCIGLWIAQEFPNATVYGADISEQAIALSQKNAAHNNIKNITFTQSDLFKNLPKDLTYDIIISNPPYVTKDEWNLLEPQVKEWEDKKALVADDNGLDLYKKIINNASSLLKEKTTLSSRVPRIVFEIGHNQANDLQLLLENESFKVIVKKDFSDKDRTIFAYHT